MWALVEEGLKDRFYNKSEIQNRLPRLIGDVEKGVIAPTAAAMELLGNLDT
jgi:hypothetical protein